MQPHLSQCISRGLLIILMFAHPCSLVYISNASALKTISTIQLINGINKSVKSAISCLNLYSFMSCVPKTTGNIQIIKAISKCSIFTPPSLRLPAHQLFLPSLSPLKFLFLFGSPAIFPISNIVGPIPNRITIVGRTSFSIFAVATIFFVIHNSPFKILYLCVVYWLLQPLQNTRNTMSVTFIFCSHSRNAKTTYCIGFKIFHHPLHDIFIIHISKMVSICYMFHIHNNTSPLKSLFLSYISSKALSASSLVRNTNLPKSESLTCHTTKTPPLYSLI